MSYRSIGADLTWYGSKNTTAPASMQRKTEPSAWSKAGDRLLQGLTIAGQVAALNRPAAPPPSSSSNLPLYLALGGGALLLVVLLGKK